jgi:hypothetical protein
VILTALALAAGLSPAPEQAWSTVEAFYAQVVKHQPLGLPDGGAAVALRPFLSTRLQSRLQYAEACERDYARQQPQGSTDKPDYGWLEAGLFSGFSERAAPQAAEVVHTEDEGGGRMRVYVQLTYVDRHPQYPVTDVWHRAAVVTAEDGVFRVDDVVALDDETLDDRGGIDEILAGCDRGRWIGRKD